MLVIGLIGPPGSGKSHRALLVAHEYSIPLIIDDGLLIKNSLIVAGMSSKRQRTKIGAIRTALFTDQSHANEIKEAITTFNPEKLLVLGTSTKMLNKITDRLDLPAPAELIFIDEIASKKEIQKAREIRARMGKHVIPAPTVEVKSRLSGLLVDPLPTVLKRRSESERQKHFMVNQTVVQPTFNFFGNFYIQSTAINHIITITAEKIQGVAKAYHIRTRTTSEGIEVSLHLVIVFGFNILDVSEQVRREIKKTLEYMTSLHVLEINTFVKKLEREKDN